MMPEEQNNKQYPVHSIEEDQKGKFLRLHAAIAQTVEPATDILKQHGINRIRCDNCSDVALHNFKKRDIVCETHE